MSTLRFRLPGASRPLGEWLARLLPGAPRATRRAWIERGAVRVDGRVVDRGAVVCPPGATVSIELDADEAAALDPPAADPAPGERVAGPARAWEALLDWLPWERGRLETASGVGLEFVRADGTRADTLRHDAERIADRKTEGSGEIRVRVEAEAPVEAWALLDAFAELGLPILGDRRRGGLGLPEGPRLVPLGRDGSTRIEAPSEPVWRPDANGAPDAGAANPATDVDASAGAAGTAPPAELRVSRETARQLAAGHPWILSDAASDPVERFRPGALVRVVDREDRALGWAHVEAGPRIAARVWSAGSGSLRAAASVEARIAKALAHRRSLLEPAASARTDAIRLVHGEADGLPGLFVDRLGPLLRVQRRGAACEGFAERALDGLLAQLPLDPEGRPWSVLELSTIPLSSRAADRRAGTVARPSRVGWRRGGLAALSEAGVEVDSEGLEVLERGLRFRVDTGWTDPSRPRPGFGLFLDQRENRARLADRAATGGHWLNLFAHTGAFSVALLAAGATGVVSVDLSAPYLARLEANLAANRPAGVDPARHTTVRGDARRYLESLDPGVRFRGIVIDPPTAAAAGRRFWSVSRELEPLLDRALARLEPGGSLLVTQNRAGPPLGLDQRLERAAARQGRRVDRIDPAPAGEDHPALRGFPEGDPFEGWLVSLL